MTEFVKWEQTKRKARAQDPDSESPQRLAQRERVKQGMLARTAGARLADLRKEQGITQKQVAAATGLSQARISQIENGKTVGLDVLRAYITGLGGQVEIVARVGRIRLDIA
jgi:DNA-binding XRE family transcriptional regulator